jgi:sulfur relay (sulfurtransferase) DsrC/TusE family protein
MQNKKKQITDSNIKNIVALIKSLGGAKIIYNYLISKNININIESIYKWKTNGIPYRYRSHIKELAENNNINITEKIFPDTFTSSINHTEIISNSINKEEINNIIHKRKDKIFIFFLLLGFLTLVLQFLYYQHNNKILNEKIVKLENLVSLISKKNYDAELSNFNKIIIEHNDINESNVIKIKENLKSISINTNKINVIEKNITDILNKKSYLVSSKNNDSSKILISLILIKYNIKFTNPNLTNIKLINNYFDKFTTPRDVSLSLKNLNKLSKINLKSHFQLVKDITIILNVFEENNASNDDKKFSFSKYLKKIIKINKVDDTSFTNKRNIALNISDNLNNYNYSLIINELSKINHSNNLNLWLQDVQNLHTLNNSLENIINWLIHKG